MKIQELIKAVKNCTVDQAASIICNARKVELIQDLGFTKMYKVLDSETIDHITITDLLNGKTELKYTDKK